MTSTLLAVLFFMLTGFFITSQLFSPFCLASQTAPKTRRNLQEEIASCPFLEMIPADGWKEVQGNAENLVDQFVELGERKDYEIASAIYNDRQYIFALQVARMDLPRWVLLLNDEKTKKPLFRYSGLIKTIGYDVDQIAFPMKGCGKLTTIITLVAEMSYEMLAYEMVYKSMDEVKIMDACDKKEYRIIPCGGADKLSKTPSGEIRIESSFSVIARAPFIMMLTQGECSVHEEKVIEALRILYTEHNEN